MIWHEVGRGKLKTTNYNSKCILWLAKFWMGFSNKLQYDSIFKK